MKNLETTRGFFERHFGAVFGAVEDVKDHAFGVLIHPGARDEQFTNTGDLAAWRP